MRRGVGKQSLKSLFILLLFLCHFCHGLNLKPFSKTTTPVVDQWRVLGDGKLTGVVRGHPVIPDGDIITTSPLSNPDFCASNKVVTTLSGSRYLLKQPQYFKPKQAKKYQPPQKRGTLAIQKDMDLRVVQNDTGSKTKKKTTGGGNAFGVSRGMVVHSFFMLNESKH
jgi:hypothetical protein